MKAEILERQPVFQGFFTLEKATVRFELFDGSMSTPVTRLNVYRADASAVLLYHSVKQTISFVKQFRYPIYTVDPGHAWTLEAVAGAIDPGHTPLYTAVRETVEETGYHIAEQDLQAAGVCWPSPGGTSERIHCYVADIAGAERVNDGGGNEHEMEDIEVVELGYAKVREMVESSELCDAKTLICWYWFQKHILKA